MNKKFRYVIVIKGEINARNRAQAYMTAQIGFSLNGRLLEFPNDIAIRVDEIQEPTQEPSVAEQLFSKPRKD